MIEERREVRFDKQSLIEACRWFQTLSKQTEIPHGLITDVILSDDDPPEMTVLMNQSGASKMRIINLKPTTLLPLILYFCKKQRIPVPRHSEKSFNADEESLVMILTKEHETRGPD